MTKTNWSAAQIEFAQAMDLYETRPIYARMSRVVACVAVVLQWGLLVASWRSGLGWLVHAGLLCAAFVLADFVNGLVHLYMDHQRGYRSFVGPFVAAFHLHHDRPNYAEKPIFRVYLDESGSKIWLAIFLVLFCIQATFVGVAPWLLGLIAYFSFWSSWAEVSHFLCHNRQSAWVRRLQKYWLLLPRAHHMQHHRFDNVNYAFLNGMSDWLINWWARRFCGGYVGASDQDSALYHTKVKQRLGAQGMKGMK